MTPKMSKTPKAPTSGGGFDQQQVIHGPHSGAGGGGEGGGEPEGEVGHIPREGEVNRAAWRRGKHLTLRVPNFNDAAEPDEQMTSYLRLGAVPDPSIVATPGAPRATGEDLAAVATSFLDDERKRDGCPDFVPEEERKAVTSRLHVLGGWRDHSDGNRITTTRGDKIEVIRGNYQLIVLGRRDDPHPGVGWDVSGGHIEGIVARSAIEWSQAYDGTWRAVETTEKGDTDFTQHGDSVSQTYGDKIHSTTGSEDETRPVTDAEGKVVERVPQKNPEIIDRTWARSMEYHTGSEKWRVPTIQHETWVDSLSSKTVAGDMRDETTVDGAMSSKTMATTIQSTTIAAAMTAVNLTNMTNLNVGNMTNLNVGPMENINIGATLDITLSAMLQLCLSAAVSVNLGARADYNLVNMTELAPQKQQINAQSDIVAGRASVTAMLYKVTAAAIFLG